MPSQDGGDQNHYEPVCNQKFLSNVDPVLQDPPPPSPPEILLLARTRSRSTGVHHRQARDGEGYNMPPRRESQPNATGILMKAVLGVISEAIAVASAFSGIAAQDPDAYGDKSRLSLTTSDQSIISSDRCESSTGCGRTPRKPTDDRKTVFVQQLAAGWHGCAAFSRIGIKRQRTNKKAISITP
ncbi:hypothetical protein V8F06_013590 [Rhypophila decipiens]